MTGTRKCCRVVVTSVLILAPRVALTQGADIIGTYPIAIRSQGTGCFDESFNRTSGTFEVRSVTSSTLIASLNGGDAGPVTYDPARREIDHTYPGNIRFTGTFTRSGNTITLQATFNWTGLDCVATFSGSREASGEPSAGGGEQQQPPSETQSIVPIDGRQGELPPPTVIGGSGSTPETLVDLPDDDDGNLSPALLIGLGAVGAGVGLAIRSWRNNPAPAGKAKAGSPSSTSEFRPEPYERTIKSGSFGSIPTDEEINARLGTAQQGEPTDDDSEPAEDPIESPPEDPREKAKRLGKEAVSAGKAAAGKGKAKPEPKKPPAEEGELAKLKRERAEWEASRNAPPDPLKLKSELEKLKEEAKKKADEEELRQFLEEQEKEERRWKEEEEQQRKAEEREKADRLRREIEAIEAEKERARKEADAARDKAAREAAEEAEANARRAEREKEARERAAKEEAEEAAEAARQSAAEEAAKKAEAEKKAAAKKPTLDDIDWDKNWQLAAELLERERLLESGFTERDLAERARDLGLMELGRYERSAERMGRPEFVAEWISFGSDKAVDLIGSLTGKMGSHVKDAYIASKYFLGQAVGDMLPGGAGITKEGVWQGTWDASVEIGWNKISDILISKAINVPKGTDLSDADSHWPKGYGGDWLREKTARGDAYAKAIGSLFEGTGWDVMVNDRIKVLGKGGKDPNVATNAMEKYLLGMKE